MLIMSLTPSNKTYLLVVTLEIKIGDCEVMIDGLQYIKDDK